ncbi:MAG: Cys-tRNA(Pro)/Cys-tRNA(Cys) deacylase [Sulfurimonas sp.]|jgi:Cys-tRNA(Pro)/Cys-tRNA(Cys) deacylase
MTQCIKILKKSKVNYKIHQYVHDSNAESYGGEASEKLGISSEMVFKTLVVVTDTKKFAVGVVPVSSMLSMKLMAKALGAKKVTMADAHDVEKNSGYVLGGVSPLGQKKRLKTIINASAAQFPTIFVSAGKRGLDVELNADDLLKLLNANYADITQL